MVNKVSIQLLRILHNYRDRNRDIGIMTELRTRRLAVQIPARATDYLFTAPEAHPASCTVEIEIPSRG